MNEEMTEADYKSGIALADRFLAQLEGVGKMQALVAFAACLGMVASEIGTGPRAPSALVEDFYRRFEAARSSPPRNGSENGERQ